MLNITVTVRNQEPVQVKALPYSAMPKSLSCPVAKGTLNGSEYSFKLTKGRGRGQVTMHYGYFTHDGKIYYFTVGKQLPDTGVDVRIGDWKPEAEDGTPTIAEVKDELDKVETVEAKAKPAARKSSRSKKAA